MSPDGLVDGDAGSVGQVTGAPHHSADGGLWWTGNEWVSAWSPTRDWWFDGASWRPVAAPRRPPRLTRAEVLVAAAYVVLWIAGVIWSALAVPQANTDGVDLSTATLATGIGIIALAALGVLGCSTWLARRGRWWVIGLLIAFVAGWFFALYLAAMFSVPVPAGEPDVQDDTAAVGLMYLFFPTFAVVAVLAGVGTGAGAIWRRVSLRRSARLAGSSR